MAAVTTASTAALGSSARPRLVCTTTPVALMTRRSDGVTAASSSPAIQGTRAAGVMSSAPAAAASPPARISARSRSSTARTASTTSARGYRASSSSAAGSRSTSSTAARERSRAWRPSPASPAPSPAPFLRLLSLIVDSLVGRRPDDYPDRGARRRRTPARIIANATTPNANHQSVPVNPNSETQWGGERHRYTTPSTTRPHTRPG